MQGHYPLMIAQLVPPHHQQAAQALVQAMHGVFLLCHNAVTCPQPTCRAIVEGCVEGSNKALVCEKCGTGITVGSQGPPLLLLQLLVTTLTNATAAPPLLQPPPQTLGKQFLIRCKVPFDRVDVEVFDELAEVTQLPTVHPDPNSRTHALACVHHSMRSS